MGTEQDGRWYFDICGQGSGLEGMTAVGNCGFGRGGGGGGGVILLRWGVG